MVAITVAQLAEHLGAELRGDGAGLIEGIAPLTAAKSNQLGFLANPKYRAQLSKSAAGAVLVDAANADLCRTSALIVSNPYLAFARATGLFANSPTPTGRVDPRAIIDPSAQLNQGVTVGPNAVIEAGVKIGAGTVIGANSVVGANTVIGQNCYLAANVTLYHKVQLGDRVTIHSGAVIGADGFGFAPNGQGGWQKIHQLGGVRIGSDVEIGANTTVDRGALADTVIGNQVILDNHVQIGHNAVVGDGTAMAAFSGIAGSATVGKHCILAGAVGVVGHITVADGVQVTAKSLVTKSITVPGSYSAGTPLLPSAQWRKSAVRFGQLDELARELKELKNR